MDHRNGSGSDTGNHVGLHIDMKGSSMKKKPAKLVPKVRSMTSDDHRKLADKHRVKSRMHEVKADMLDIDEPPKGKGRVTVRPY